MSAAMRDLPEYIEHFRKRVLQDALATATSAYWLRRRDAFEAALPRPGDFTGRATAAELEAQRERVAAVALACAERARVAIGGDLDE